MLLDKYKQINKKLKDVIACHVVQSNDSIYTQILQILHKERENPKDIEELTALKEYMLQVPMELEKIQEEIKKCSEIYETLEEFQYSLIQKQSISVGLYSKDQKISLILLLKEWRFLIVIQKHN